MFSGLLLRDLEIQWSYCIINYNYLQGILRVESHRPGCFFICLLAKRDADRRRPLHGHHI